MTNKEALQGLVTVDNDNLINKTLLDRNLGNGSTEYESANKTVIALCGADIAMFQAFNPDFKEGNMSITTKKELIEYANYIYKKYDETENILTNNKKINFINL